MVSHFVITSLDKVKLIVVNGMQHENISNF